MFFCTNADKRDRPASYPGQRLPVSIRLSSHANDMVLELGIRVMIYENVAVKMIENDEF